MAFMEKGNDKIITGLCRWENSTIINSTIISVLAYLIVGIS